MRRLLVFLSFGLVDLYVLALAWLILTLLTSTGWDAFGAIFLLPVVIVFGSIALWAAILILKGNFKTASIVNFALSAPLLFLYVIPALPHLALGFLANREATKQAGYLSLPTISLGYKFRQSLAGQAPHKLLLYFNYAIVLLYPLYYAIIWIRGFIKADWQWPSPGVQLLSYWLILPTGLALIAAVETLREKYGMASLFQLLAAAFYLMVILEWPVRIYNSADYPSFIIFLVALPHVLAACMAVYWQLRPLALTTSPR